jgi:hypothetical protein
MAKIFFAQQNAFNGMAAQSIEITTRTGSAGIQPKLESMGVLLFEMKQTFTGACYLRNESRFPFLLRFALEM